MIPKKQYPTAEGWIYAKLTLSSAEALGDEGIAAMKDLMSGGETGAHEFPVLEQHGKTIKAIYRRKLIV